MLNRIKKKIRNAIIAFSYGLKNTETDILGQKTTISEANVIDQKMQMNNLADALLNGVVTEEVKVLRDRTYLISDESKKYKVIIDTVGTTKAVKNMVKLNIPKIYTGDYDVDIVMDNNPIPSGVIDAFQSVGKHGIANIYPLKFTYEYTPKFKLEDYVRKFVVRSDSDGNVKLDLYVPKFTDSFERLEKLFDNELNKISSKKGKTFNIEFDFIDFVSDKAYGVDDLRKYKFKMIKFVEIFEFDGSSVLSYDVLSIGDNEKITEKYKNKKLRDNYENKTSRGTKLNLGNQESEKHNCEECGVEIKNDYDYRITKQTIGKGICQECLLKIDVKNI